MTQPFTPNESFDRVFLLKGIDERRTRNGKPYLAVVLGTPEGAWEARVWDMDMSSLPGLLEGDPVRAKGTAQLYLEKVQLIVDEISRIDEQVDPRSIYPASGTSEKQLRDDFDSLAGKVKEPALKTLLETMLSDPKIGDAYFVSPAAVTMHHARIGGLAEHSINVCRLALGAAAAADWLDSDLLIVGALLHDVGKVLEYEMAGDFRPTLEGKFLGHIMQGHSLMEKWIDQIPDFDRRLALDVLHILLSHHGQLEFGSPKTPITAEALVIHFADDLDAKLDMIQTAGEDPDTEEAFVRGLRRSFQYRSEAPPEWESRREGEGETEKEAGTRRHRDAENTDEGTGRGAQGAGKNGGQGEMF